MLWLVVAPAFRPIALGPADSFVDHPDTIASAFPDSKCSSHWNYELEPGMSFRVSSAHSGRWSFAHPEQPGWIENN